MQTQWKDDFTINQMLRKKFRQEKKVILEKEEKDQEIKEKGGLDLDLVNEDPDDIKRAKNIRFRTEGTVGEFLLFYVLRRIRHLGCSGRLGNLNLVWLM